MGSEASWARRGMQPPTLPPTGNSGVQGTRDSALQITSQPYLTLPYLNCLRALLALWLAQPNHHRRLTIPPQTTFVSTLCEYKCIKR